GCSSSLHNFPLRRDLMKFRILRYVFLFCLLGSLYVAAQQVAPDATPIGPLPTASGEYDLGAQIDNLVLPGCQPVSGYDCKVDVRAHVYYPRTLTGSYPVIIFLHGNHGTCGTPDPTASGEYDLGAQIGKLLLPGCQPVSGYDCKVDVRAHVYYPRTLTGTYPVIIFLHGNHGTCGTPDPGLPGDPRNDDSSDYTGTGMCPPGYIESPSYLGYDYMAFRECRTCRG